MRAGEVPGKAGRHGTGGQRTFLSAPSPLGHGAFLPGPGTVDRSFQSHRQGHGLQVSDPGSVRPERLLSGDPSPLR